MVCILDTAEKATNGINGGGLGSTRVDVSVKSWDYPAYVTESADSAGSQCDAIEVTVAYDHQMVTPIIKAILPGGVTLKGKQRMTNEPFGPCT